MGRRGVKPLPTALKVLHGSFIKNPQTRNKQEPEAPDGRPRCPAHLPAIAKTRWTHICKMLEAMNMQTPANLDALEVYCKTYATWRDAVKILHDEGLVIGDKVNPMQRVVKDCSEVMIRLLVQFGLTPSSRSTIHCDKIEVQQVKRRQRT